MKASIIDLHLALQGEGIFMGVPSILIRVSGCNLRCVFRNSICDTAYSSHNPEASKYSYEDIQKIVTDNPQITHLILSGGEPCLYPELIQQLIENFPDHIITVETNGTIYPGSMANKIDLFSISPKLSSSTPTKEKIQKLNLGLSEGWEEKHEGTRENIEAIVKLIRAGRSCQLKYVISCPEDFSEVESQIKRIEEQIGTLLDKQGIFLMPEGDSEEKLQENRKMVAELCIKHGTSYSDRLQYVIYGSKRDA